MYQIFGSDRGSLTVLANLAGLHCNPQEKLTADTTVYLYLTKNDVDLDHGEFILPRPGRGYHPPYLIPIEDDMMSSIFSHNGVHQDPTIHLSQKNVNRWVVISPYEGVARFSIDTGKEFIFYGVTPSQDSTFPADGHRWIYPYQGDYIITSLKGDSQLVSQETVIQLLSDDGLNHM